MRWFDSIHPLFEQAHGRSLQALAQCRASASQAEGSTVKSGCTQISFPTRLPGNFLSDPPSGGRLPSRYGGCPLGHYRGTATGAEQFPASLLSLESLDSEGTWVKPTSQSRFNSLVPRIELVVGIAPESLQGLVSTTNSAGTGPPAPSGGKEAQYGGMAGGHANSASELPSLSSGM